MSSESHNYSISAVPGPSPNRKFGEPKPTANPHSGRVTTENSICRESGGGDVSQSDPTPSVTDIVRSGSASSKNIERLRHDSGDETANLVPEAARDRRKLDQERGGESPPSSSNSSTSADSSDECERGKRRSQKEKVSGSVKAWVRERPPVYNGETNVHVFDKWVYSVRVWKDILGLDSESMVKDLGQMVSGKAAVFYKNQVLAAKPNQWRLSAIFDALFNYCFTPKYKLMMRKRLMSSSQGRRRFREFADDTETLAERLADMSSLQIIQIIWDGAILPIRIRWIKSGCSPTSTPLQELIKVATRYEMVEALACGRKKKEQKAKRA